MKINGITVIRVDDRGMDSLLAILGYPEKSRMNKWLWKDFYAEVEGFLFEEESYDMERELSGERIHNKPYENMRTEEDDMYDEWLYYLKEGE